MKATLILYIVMGALFLVPLILFNIRRNSSGSPRPL